MPGVRRLNRTSGLGTGRMTDTTEVPAADQRQNRIRSTRLISDRISMSTSIRDTRARRLRRSKSLPLRPSSSSPVTLADHLHQQLSVLVLPEAVRDAADSIIGNLDENGYLMPRRRDRRCRNRMSARTWSRLCGWFNRWIPRALELVACEECLLIQIEGRNGTPERRLADYSNHLNLLESRQIARNLPRRWAAPGAHPDCA